MFDFSSWRVRTRLTVGFGVVCVLLVASVLMGLMAMSRMGADLKAVVADHFPRIVAAANLSTQIDVIAIALRNMMLNADAADRERQTQVIAQSRQEVVRLFDTLDKTLTEPKDRALLQKVKEQRALYLAGQEELLGFIRSDQTDQSREYLASKLQPVLASYKASIGALVESEKNAIVTACWRRPWAGSSRAAWCVSWAASPALRPTWPVPWPGATSPSPLPSKTATPPA